MSTWMAYAAVVTLLLGSAAWVLERATHNLRFPSRWIWAAALAGSTVLPVVAFLTRVQQPVPLSLDSGAALGVTAPTVQPNLTPDYAPAPPSFTIPRLRLPPTPALPARLDPLAVVGWLFVTLVLLIGVLRSLRRLGRAREEWPSEQLDGRDVLVSEGVGPAVVGVLRPAIVMPRWALGLSPQDRELMLRHEEEHQRAGDAPLLLSAVLLSVLLPWNLPLWWQLRRLRLAVEVDCDRRVLRHTRNLRRYASLLVEIGRRRSSPLMSLALAEPASFLERRIRHMTRHPKPRYVQSAGLVLAGSLLVVVAGRLDRPAPLVPADQSPIAMEVQPQRIGSQPVLGTPVTSDERTGRILIPREAVVLRGEREREVAFIAKDLDGEGYGRTDWRYVTTRPFSRTHVEVVPAEETSMLAVGDVVLVDGHRYLAHDTPIRVTLAPTPAFSGVAGPRAPLYVKAGEMVTEAPPGRAGEAASNMTVTAPPEAADSRVKTPEAGQIRGRVTDVANGEPIADARVFLVGTSLVSVSTDAGAYALAAVPAGTHELRVERVGYASSTRLVALTDGAVLETDFALTGEAAIVRPAAAPSRQTRITGRVTDTSGNPLADVQVYLVGASLGALSRQTGQFLILNAPAGSYTVRAERIGLQTASREITVAEGEVLELNFELAGSVAASDSALAALRLGIPDAGARIRLRGENSTSQPPPIIYIDGVRITPSPGDSPLSQLKPEEIERIEVIKGSAAVQLYGPEAISGVIQVFKKKPATPGGAASFTPPPGFDPESLRMLRSLGLPGTR